MPTARQMHAVFRVFGLLGLAMGGCNCQGAGLAVGGATPYVRCLASEPPALDVQKVGRVELRAEKRQLVVAGLVRPIRIAAFSGPAFGPPPDPAQVDALAEAKPDLVLVLGGLGDGEATVRATVEALARLPVPSLVVAGGRDGPSRFVQALEGLPEAAGRVIDVSGFDTVHLGEDVLVPVSGSASGRYAIAEDACGYGLDDLKHRATAVGPPQAGARRWLVSWEAPGGGGPRAVARTEAGVDTGAVDLAELADRVGAKGGLFAWPTVQAMRPRAGAGARSVDPGVAAEDLRLVVPRLTGMPLERSDGSLVPAGFALVRLGEGGLALEAGHAWKTASDDAGFEPKPKLESP